MEEELGRASDPDGNELVLRRKEGGFEVFSGDQVILASAARRSEQELVRLGLGPLRDRTDITVLLGGLGMGYALRALLDDPRVIRVDVVEHNAALIDWNREHFAVLHKEPPLTDPRVHLHNMEFQDFLAALSRGEIAELKAQREEGAAGTFFAIVLDLDDGPAALSRPANAGIYTDEGLTLVEDALRPGGVLALWSSQREQDLMTRVRGRFQNVAEMLVPVDQGLDYIYRLRRAPLAAPAPAGSSNGHHQAN